MLILSRKRGERIRIGDNVTVVVLEVRGSSVRLGFDGPADIPIHREEVHRRIKQERPRELVTAPRQFESWSPIVTY